MTMEFYLECSLISLMAMKYLMAIEITNGNGV